MARGLDDRGQAAVGVERVEPARDVHAPRADGGLDEVGVAGDGGERAFGIDGTPHHRKHAHLADARAQRERFAPPTTAPGTLGHRRDAVWLHLPLAVAAGSDGRWVLDLEYAVLNRIDLHLRVGAVKLAALGEMAAEETSATVRARVAAARERQRSRYTVLPGIRLNAEAPGRWLQQHGRMTTEAKTLLSDAADRLRISARAYHRALRVARTVADLDGEERIEAGAIAEALLFRATDSHEAPGSG